MNLEAPSHEELLFHRQLSVSVSSDGPIDLPSANIYPSISSYDIFYQVLQGVLRGFRLCPRPDLIMTRLGVCGTLWMRFVPGKNLDLQTYATHGRLAVSAYYGSERKTESFRGGSICNTCNCYLGPQERG